MSDANVSKSTNIRKKPQKQPDVTCWNCFTSEDNDVNNIEAVPLPKVREEHRDKLKVYSFLASELSKPKAVSLGQKISEPFLIGKKIEANISKQQTVNVKEDSVSGTFNDSFNFNNESRQTISHEQNISQALSAPNVEVDNKISNNIYEVDSTTNIQKNKLYLLKQQTNLENFVDTSSIINEQPFPINDSISCKNENELLKETQIQIMKCDNVSENKNYCDENSTRLPNEVNTSHDVNEISFSISHERTIAINLHESLALPDNVGKDNIINLCTENTNQDIVQDLTRQQKYLSQQPYYEQTTRDNENVIDYQSSTSELPKSTTEFKTRVSVEKNTSNILSSATETLPIKSRKSISMLPIFKNTPNRLIKNKTIDYVPSSSEKLVKEKTVNAPHEKSPITPLKLRNTKSDTKIPVLKHPSPKLLQKTIAKFQFNPKTTTQNVAGKIIKQVDTCTVSGTNNNRNVKEYQFSSHQNNNNKSIDNDKIVNKVQVVTSTPKEKNRVANEIILEDDLVNTERKILCESKKEKSQNCEKVDTTSSNGSESGYAGSLPTVQDFNIDENCGKSYERNKEDEVFKKDIDEIASSFSLLRINNNPTSSSSLSLHTDSNVIEKSKPAKSMRWSTLSKVPRSVSFEDEVYISEAASPGHATLPRRSNSPLPHERDMDRDRFPINRSGLQVRSESMASVYSGAGEGLRGSVTVRGDVQFSLLYNYRLGALEVGVKRCRDLAPIDVKRNRSDPYVKVYLLPDKSKAGKRKTKVKKNTLNPVFEETLSFVQPLASLSSRTLWLSAWHADMFGRNDFLGEVTLPLADVVFDDPAPMWYKLHERTEQFDEQHGLRGDLIVGLKFELLDAARGKGTLHVLVKEAKNLVATKPNGLADVFCKSYLLPERGRLAKQKTNVVRRSLNPRWEHTFTYRGLTMQELATRALELSIWDRDRLASNDFMGAVRLSLATGTYMGASVNWMDSMGKEITLWQNMMQQPNLWVEGSLPLRPQLIN